MKTKGAYFCPNGMSISLFTDRYIFTGHPVYDSLTKKTNFSFADKAASHTAIAFVYIYVMAFALTWAWYVCAISSLLDPFTIQDIFCSRPTALPGFTHPRYSQ